MACKTYVASFAHNLPRKYLIFRDLYIKYRFTQHGNTCSLDMRHDMEI